MVSIFIAGNLLEGYVLTPRLVGDRVGLHPVWVLFALLAGASLFGFLGVLIAVPTAAVVGVLVRFALSQYLASPYHTGDAAAPVEPGRVALIASEPRER
jgi:predicted PurR-regulated permease PerM